VVTSPKHIFQETAWRHPTPTELHAIYRDTNPLDLVKVNQERGTVTRGMAPLDAIEPHAIEANIGAPSVDHKFILPNNAMPLSELLCLYTPFIASEWETALNNISSFNSFSDVPIDICFGFDMGVSSPTSYTYTPPNHNSTLSYPDHVYHIYRKNYLPVVILAPFHVLDYKL
jgi:hypothetical protein